MMDDELLLPERLCANLCTSTVFRICSINPQSSSDRPYGLDASGSITAENPSWPATQKMARYHLLWSRIHTPFISVFNQYRRALDWAQMLEQKGCTHLYMIVISTSGVPQGQLWNAHQIAADLGFPAERLQFHEDEYLFSRSVKRECILAVLPARGPRIPVSVHMGTLTLPQSCFEAIGSQDVDAVRVYLQEEIRRRCGNSDEALLQQTVHALCTDRQRRLLSN